jgi:metal-sulfur cluster biosynthetic enzyme
MIDRQDVLDELRNILDPELQLSIVDLGLIYRVEVEKDRIEVDYTLTTPGCPEGPLIEMEIQETLQEITDIDDIRLKLVWEPQWGPEKMSEELRLSLGYPI